MNHLSIREIFKPDNSLTKHRKSQTQKFYQETEKIISKNRQIARKNIKKTLMTLQDRNFLLKRLIKNQKILNLNLDFYEEAPIIKIQTQVRRWLCVKNFEILKLKKNEEKCQKDLIDLAKEVSEKLMMGESTRSAMLLIVKNIKIFLWRRKIKRIKHVFENYYLKSTKNFLTVFTNSMLVWSSRNKVSYMQYLHDRKLKLLEIRKRLAILSIKKAIHDKKFNLSVGRYLFQKIRRRRKRFFTFNTVQGPSHEIYGLTAHETLSWLLHDKEDDFSETELKLRENRLNLMKVAHGIKEKNSKSVSPVLGRKFCQTPVRSTASHLSETQKFRSLSINTPPLTTQKRMFFNSELPSRLMAYPTSQKNKPRPLSCSSKVPPDKNFLKPTEFFLRKHLVEKGKNCGKGKTRPPSCKLVKDTESSMAKRKEKRRFSGKTKENDSGFYRSGEGLWMSR